MLHPFSQVRKMKCCDLSNFSQVTKLETTESGHESKGSALFPLVLRVSLSSHTPFTTIPQRTSTLHASKPWHLVLSSTARKGIKKGSLWPFSSPHIISVFESWLLGHFDILISVLFCFSLTTFYQEQFQTPRNDVGMVVHTFKREKKFDWFFFLLALFLPMHICGIGEILCIGKGTAFLLLHPSSLAPSEA